MSKEKPSTPSGQSMPLASGTSSESGANATAGIPVKKLASRRRIVLRLLAGGAAAVLLLFAALSIYTQTPAFKRHLRALVVAQLETATGGRVELDSFHCKPWLLEITMRGLTIHGLEAPGEVPYAHVDAISLHLKPFSLFGHGVHLRNLVLERPVFHLIIHPDGSTNVPSPKVSAPARQDLMQPLIDLAVTHATVRNGWFLWNQERWPLELSAQPLGIKLDYNAAHRIYDGHLLVRGLNLQIMQLRPMPVDVDATFAVLPDRLNIQQARVTTGDTVIDTRGSVTDLPHTRLELSYRATTELAWVSRISDMAGLRHGHATLTGSGWLQHGDYVTTGLLALSGGEYQDSVIHLPDVTAASQYRLDSDGVRLDHIQAQALGGQASGSLSAPWDSILQPQAGELQMQLHAIPLDRALAAISDATLPLDKLNGSGQVEGTMHTQWRHGLHNTVTSFALRLNAPLAPPPGTLPFDGRIEAAYDNAASLWHIGRFEAATPLTSLQASGELGSHSGELQLSASSSSLAGWEPFLSAMGATSLPVVLHGPSSFAGTLHGTLRAPSIAGHFDLRDFVTLPQPAQRAAGNAATQRLLHWDEFSGELDYAPQHLRLASTRLRHGAATLEIDGSLALTGGAPQAGSALDARLQLRQLDLAEVARLEDSQTPYSGSLTASLRLGGSYAAPSGSGEATLRDAAIDGLSLRQVHAALRFQNSQLDATAIEATGAFGTLHGEGGYNLASSAFHFSLNGSQLSLAELTSAHFSRPQLAGRLSLRLQGSGTPAAPILEASGSLADVTLNRQPLGGASFSAYTGGEYLHATLRSTGSINQLQLDGTVRLREQWQSHWQTQWQCQNLSPLINALLPVRLDDATALQAAATADGPLLRPQEMIASLRIEHIATQIDKIPLRNQSPIELDLSRQIVTIRKMRLGGEGSRFFDLQGTAELSGARRLWMQASGDIDLRGLQSFHPGLTAAGAANFNVRLAGTLDHPRLDGQLQVQNASLSLEGVPNGLSEINGSLRFNQDRLSIQKLTARSGGGEAEITGFLSYDHGVALMLAANAHDIRVRYPAGVSSTASAQLTLGGNLDDLNLGGTITVTRFGVNSQFDATSLLTRGKEALASTTPATGSNLHLDLHILTSPELQLQTPQARIAGNADLRLRGTIAHPTLLGRVNITEGELNFNDARYHIDRGDITFTDPVRMNPALNIQLSANVRDYDITLGLSGTPDKLRPTYHSDPPLPEGDIVALLAFGRTSESSTKYSGIAGSQQQTMTLTDSASSQLLGQALNSTLSSRAQKLFGISRIKIDPQVGSTETTSNARVTVEQQISNKATLTYVSNVTQSAQQVIQFEYNINRNVSLLAVRDENGVFGVEVRIRQRRR
jgi:translocation and assembly module TamB